jgi:hypothetical protein
MICVMQQATINNLPSTIISDMTEKLLSIHIAFHWATALRDLITVLVQKIYIVTHATREEIYCLLLVALVQMLP